MLQKADVLRFHLCSGQMKRVLMRFLLHPMLSGHEAAIPYISMAHASLYKGMVCMRDLCVSL